LLTAAHSLSGVALTNGPDVGRGISGRRWRRRREAQKGAHALERRLVRAEQLLVVVRQPWLGRQCREHALRQPM
jgi:hypothetical protein